MRSNEKKSTIPAKKVNTATAGDFFFVTSHIRSSSFSLSLFRALFHLFAFPASNWTSRK